MMVMVNDEEDDVVHSFVMVVKWMKSTSMINLVIFLLLWANTKQGAINMGQQYESTWRLLIMGQQIRCFLYGPTM